VHIERVRKARVHGARGADVRRVDVADFGRLSVDAECAQRKSIKIVFSLRLHTGCLGDLPPQGDPGPYVLGMLRA
jgi:hypothetical protein